MKPRLYENAAGSLLFAGVAAFTLLMLIAIEGDRDTTGKVAGVLTPFLFGAMILRGAICSLLAVNVFQGKVIDLTIAYVAFEALIVLWVSAEVARAVQVPSLASVVVVVSYYTLQILLLWKARPRRPPGPTSLRFWVPWMFA